MDRENTRNTPHTHTLYIYTYVVLYYIVRPYIARRCALIYKHSDIRKPLEKKKPFTKNLGQLCKAKAGIKKTISKENDPLSNEKQKQKSIYNNVT